MKKQILIRCGLGFVMGLGMMLLVPSLLQHGPVLRILYSDRLLEQTGSPGAATALSLVVIGVFGAMCFVGTLFYEIERWPLALATCAHYLVISLGYLIPAQVLCWDMPLKLLVLIEGAMTLGFFLIWLILYLRYKAQVRELNELTRRIHPWAEASGTGQVPPPASRARKESAP